MDTAVAVSVRIHRIVLNNTTPDTLAVRAWEAFVSTTSSLRAVSDTPPAKGFIDEDSLSINRFLISAYRFLISVDHLLIDTDRLSISKDRRLISIDRFPIDTDPFSISFDQHWIDVDQLSIDVDRFLIDRDPFPDCADPNSIEIPAPRRKYTARLPKNSPIS